MASIVSIGIIPEKKAPRQECEAAQLIAGGGIEGDLHQAEPQRAISMVDIGALEQMKRLEGLCASKFAANLVTEGLALGRLEPGCLLVAGEAVLRITQVGKECFAHCGLDDRSACLLRTECAFGVVVSGKALHRGDVVAAPACGEL